MKKRILSFILVLCMVLTFVPTSAIADGRWNVINRYNVSGTDIVNKAREYIGTGRDDSGDYRTRTGFTSPQKFDCSGLVYRVCREVGLTSSRANYSMGVNDNNGKPLEGKDSLGNYYITAHTGEQRYYGTDLSSAVSNYKSTGSCSMFKPGDLMFFDYNGDNYTDHVGIYTGSNSIINSTSSRGTVETPLSQTGWPNGTLGASLFAASRLVGDSGGGSTALSVKKTTECKFYVTIPANYLLKNYTSPTDTNALSSNYVLARSEPYTLGCKAKYEMSDNTVRYFWTSGDEPPKDLYFIYDSSYMSVTPGHNYTSSVTEPTCTEQGYTTYTCSCGDTYKDDYTSALGHNYSYGTCTRCGKIDPDSISGVCGDNLKWELKDGVLSIGGTGKMYNYSKSNPAPWTEDYKDCIESFKLANGVKSIGDYAFAGCTNLTVANIDNSRNTIFSFLNRPSTVTRIGECAFEGCSELESVEIPDSVTSIGNHAFSGCNNLATIYISSIEAWCNIDFEDSPFSHEHDLYLNNELLEELVIPDSVSSIGANAFSYCSSLTSVVMPNSITSIGEDAFSYCNNLTSITIPDSVTDIESFAFAYCNNLTSITIPDSVTNIGGYAFEYCRNLESVTLGNGVVDINIYTFYDCSSLKSVTIPDSVSSIEARAFAGCTSLTTVSIPDNLTDIKLGAFAGTPWLAARGDLPVVNGVLLGCRGTPEEIVIPSDVTIIGNAACMDCVSLKSVTIPDSVTSICFAAFLGCSNIKDVYYVGTEAQWNSIDISDNNHNLLNANIHFAVHSHDYTATTTKPTCTEQGYTTYTCECGDSNVADYVPAIGHDFVNGKCTRCGADDPTPDPVINAGRIVISDARARAGEEVTVDVSIEDNPGIMVMALGIDYDRTKLELIGFEDGIMTGWKVVKTAVWIGSDDVTANGVILKLKFKVLEDVEDGDIQVSLLFSEGDIANHDEEIIMPGVSNGTITVYSREPGDVTGDDKVNALDLVRLQRYLSGEDVVIGGSCDITGDGKTNALDLVRLQRYLSGEDVTIF